MSPTPSGHVLFTPSGRDLVLTRTFRAPIEDVWASITESERTRRWFGGWTGEAGPGKTVRYTMAFEEGPFEGDLTIEKCDPPRHLAVATDDSSGHWRLEAHLTETNGVTELRFTHHLDSGVEVGDVGPGWEYYLDNLVASRDGTPLPSFTDYYPAQKEYYQARAREGAEG